MAILPDFDAASFSNSATVTNPLFPLRGGAINSNSTSAVDEETGETDTQRNDHFASFATRTIEGVEVVVVRDTEYEDDVLAEDTLDWFAQDDAGNVWYMGEISVSYDYDDEGDFVGSDFDGSWEAGVDGASPGWIMEADPQVGDSYFQEFYQGVAEDEGEVVATGLTVETGLGAFSDVVKILDTSALDPGEGAFKYFAPGIGMVLEEEILLAEPDDPELVIELENIREVDSSAPVDPRRLAFAGDGSTKTITFLSEDGEENGAIGAYTFDNTTGRIGEARILFDDTEDTEAGATARMRVGEGRSLGLFLVPDEENVGVELEDYRDGGLFFRNFQSGDVADLYDGDPDTTYTPGGATVFDELAPVVTDADGNFLPIRAFHAAGNRGDFNFLNPVAGKNAAASDVADGIGGVRVVGFEDGLASTEDYDADFDDALVAVSQNPLSTAKQEALQEAIGISRLVGTDDDDRLRGTADDDQLIALDGDDRVAGGTGDDIIEASDGNDQAKGGRGDDEIEGEEGRDRLWGGRGDDEIEGGEGRDQIRGGRGDDEVEGDEGSDKVRGGGGPDEVFGGEGNDDLSGGNGADRVAGGTGDDKLAGGRGWSDVFVFDLTEVGTDMIRRFEVGLDVIEIATFTGVERFGDLDIEQAGDDARFDLADGEIILRGLSAASLTADDFAFV